MVLGIGGVEDWRKKKEEFWDRKFEAEDKEKNKIFEMILNDNSEDLLYLCFTSVSLLYRDITTFPCYSIFSACKPT